MLIGIDGNEANVKDRDGVHQYSYEILWALYQLRHESESEHKFIVYLKNNPSDDFPRENEYWEYRVLSGSGVWVITKLMPRLFKKPRLDVFFAPSHYLPPLTLMPKVCTIHDLGYLKYSAHFRKYDFWQLKYWSAISIYVSKYIISVSNSTKNDIVRHYHRDPKNIVVTHHGYDHKRFNTNISNEDVRRVGATYKLSKDYILFLSTIKPSKNLDGLLEAYTILKHRNSTYPELVIAGKKGWMYDSVFKIVKSLNLSNDVIFTDYISEEDKPGLLKGARVFVSPSHWEGFGMHVLEAMACGTPVVVSEIASLPEVAGKAGIYVDPNNHENIADGIERVLNMTTKRYNELVGRTVAQAKTFSWDKAAKDVLRTLEMAKEK